MIIHSIVFWIERSIRGHCWQVFGKVFGRLDSCMNPSSTRVPDTIVPSSIGVEVDGFVDSSFAKSNKEMKQLSNDLELQFLRSY